MYIDYCFQNTKYRLYFIKITFLEHATSSLANKNVISLKENYLFKIYLNIFIWEPYFERSTVRNTMVQLNC
jgi:hypothetical protein